jgi:nucleoid-associated protein YgaU
VIVEILKLAGVAIQALDPLQVTGAAGETEREAGSRQALRIVITEAVAASGRAIGRVGSSPDGRTT